jgi:HemY protein
MLRLLAFLAALGLIAVGLSWLAEIPGAVTLNWRGADREVSLITATGIVLALAVIIAAVWGILRFVMRAPAALADANRARRREKGLMALSRGMIAIGAGDARQAGRYAVEADKYLGDESLTKLLRAQSAQLSGDRAGAVAAFNEMLAIEDTHLLGLRGLHVEARRAGQAEAALDYARRANARASVPWAAQAVLDDHARRADWGNALAAVEANAEARLLDKPTANRWRAVLQTALATERAERDAKGALALAREALDLAPSLVPAAAICGKLTAAAGDLRKAARMLETAYAATPHPDLAAAYVRLRLGDSAGDRLTRARALARVAPFDPESVLTIARAALEAQDLPAARKAMAPLVGAEAGFGRPTARACILMAEIEDAAGDDGAVREWLNRAARAPRDRAWVADTIITDKWAPASPSGALDAFVWRTPDERSTEPTAIALRAAPPAPPAPPPVIEAKPAPAAVAPPTAPAAPPPARSAPRVVPPLAVAPLNAPDDPGPNVSGGEEFRNYAIE